MKTKLTTTKRLFGAFIFFALLSPNSGFAGDTAHVHWLVTQNDKHNFKAKIQIKSSNNFKLGSVTLVFNFNNSGLANIAYDPLALKSGDYSSSFYSGSNTGIVVIYYSGTESDGFDLTSTFIDVGEISFTVTDANEKANLCLNKSNSVVRKSTNSGCVPISTIDEYTFLPVTWLSIKYNERVLSWATASEINNSHFIILRSYDHDTYENIGYVQGNGSKNSISKYSFADYSIDKNQKNVYYKIEQIDFNGQSNFSRIILVKNKENLTDRVSITNTGYLYTLHFKDLEESSAKIEILNNSGQNIFSNSYSIQDKIVFDMENYLPGMYYFIVHTNIGYKSFKIAKN